MNAVAVPPIDTVTDRSNAVDAPAPRVTTNVAVSPSSVALASVAAIVAAGSSAICAVADTPSTVKITVSTPSIAGWNVGVTVTTADACPPGIPTMKESVENVINGLRCCSP